MDLSPEEFEDLIGTIEEEVDPVDLPDPFVPPEGSERLTARQRAAVTELILTFLESNGAADGHR
jgi:hypothetical protein